MQELAGLRGTICGPLRDVRTVLTIWAEVEYSGEGVARAHMVQDLRGPEEVFAVWSQGSKQTLKGRTDLGGFQGCVLHKGAS